MSDSDSDALSLPGDVEQVEEHVEEEEEGEEEEDEEEDEEELEAFCETCGAVHLGLANWNDGYGLVCMYCHEEHECYEYGVQMEREEIEDRIDETIGRKLFPYDSDEDPAEEPVQEAEEPVQGHDEAAEADAGGGAEPAADDAEPSDEPASKRARQ